MAEFFVAAFGSIGLMLGLLLVWYCFKMVRGATPHHYHPKSDIVEDECFYDGD